MFGVGIGHQPPQHPHTLDDARTRHKPPCDPLFAEQQIGHAAAFGIVGTDEDVIIAIAVDIRTR